MQKIYVLADDPAQVHNERGFALYRVQEVVDNRKETEFYYLRLSGQLPPLESGKIFLFVGDVFKIVSKTVEMKNIRVYSADENVFEPYPFTFMGEWVASTPEDEGYW